MMRPGLPAVAAFVALAMAGCGGPGLDDEATPETACRDVQVGAGCVGLADAAIALDDCIQLRAVVQLTEAVYDLPPGYSNDAMPGSPQSLSISWARCATLAVGGWSVDDVSWGHVGVLVDAGPRNQGEEADSFDLEVLTDQPALAALFRHAGFAVANGTISIADEVTTRQANVEGDVAYEAQAAFVPLPPGSIPIEGSLAHHSETAWLDDDRLCIQYFGDAALRITATEGALAAAMPQAGFLVGDSSQNVLCDIDLSFAWFV
jgi:hypothetical protein